MRNILFITWDGPDTSYLESLFLPIFRQLKNYGYQFHVLQFSWADEKQRTERLSHCRNAGVPYRCVSVMRGAGAIGPFLTALFGARHIKKAARDWNIGTLMPRSLMPAIAVLQMGRSNRSEFHIVFDADGLAVDERVDFGGLSPHSLTYRLLRDVEAEMLRSADVILTRTSASCAILQAREGAEMQPHRYYIVSNGVDAKPFEKSRNLRSEKTGNTFDMCYSGSLGQQYRLPDMLSIAVKLKNRIDNFRFHIFTRAQDVVAIELERQGLLADDWITTRSLSASEVPAAMISCDLGIALREPRFSTKAVLPIKLGEYLHAGLPVIGTPGVGKCDQLTSVGVFHSAEEEDFDSMVEWLCHEVIPWRDEMREQCYKVALDNFSLEGVTEDYALALSSCEEASRRSRTICVD